MRYLLDAALKLLRRGHLCEMAANTFNKATKPKAPGIKSNKKAMPAHME